MFLSVVLYLSPNSIQPSLTVEGLLQQLHSSNFLFSLHVVTVTDHTLSKELNLGQEGIIFSVENNLTIVEGLNEGLKFVNQSKVHTDYMCLFYDDFHLSEGYFNSILEHYVEDIDNVILTPNYPSINHKLPCFSLNGVLFRYSFFQLMLGRLYQEYVSWQDYPYYYAIARRFKIVKSKEAHLTPLNYRFKKKSVWLGIGMGYKEKKHTLVYVLRSSLKLFSHIQFAAGFFLIIGYFRGSTYRYPSKLIRKVTLTKMKELTALLSD